MAINSQEKRASADSDDMSWDEDGFFPDGVFTAADRQDTTHTYRGILASAPVFIRKFKDWWWTT